MGEPQRAVARAGEDGVALAVALEGAARAVVALAVGLDDEAARRRRGSRRWRPATQCAGSGVRRPWSSQRASMSSSSSESVRVSSPSSSSARCRAPAPRSPAWAIATMASSSGAVVELAASRPRRALVPVRGEAMSDGEVEEGAGGRGDPDAWCSVISSSRSVGVRWMRSPGRLARPAAAAHGDVDARRAGAPDLPQRRGRRVAQHRAGPGGEDRGHAPPVDREHGVPDGVDAAVDADASRPVRGPARRHRACATRPERRELPADATTPCWRSAQASDEFCPHMRGTFSSFTCHARQAGTEDRARGALFVTIQLRSSTSPARWARCRSGARCRRWR